MVEVLIMLASTNPPKRKNQTFAANSSLGFFRNFTDKRVCSAALVVKRGSGCKRVCKMPSILSTSCWDSG